MTDLSEANRKEWDSRAKTYDTQPWQQTLGEQLTTFITQQTANGFLDLHKSQDGTYSLLDYACGPGMVTRALKSYITSATGMDVSDGMVAQYNERMQRDEINATAVRGNLLVDTVDSSLDEHTGFDVAFVGLGFHHFSDSKKCLIRLRERVKAGGVVVILDWLPSDGGHHSHGHESEGKEDEFKHMRHTIAHNGFDEDMMGSLYQEAGLENFNFVVMGEPVRLVMGEKEVKKMPFLARGQAPQR